MCKDVLLLSNPSCDPLRQPKRTVRCAPLPHTTNAKGTLRRYKKLGYSSGTARAYQNHWRRKIGHLISGMLDQMELRRCMTEVRLHLPAEELQKLPLALQLSLDRMHLPAGQLKIGDRVIGRGSLGN